MGTTDEDWSKDYLRTNECVQENDHNMETAVEDWSQDFPQTKECIQNGRIMETADEDWSAAESDPHTKDCFQENYCNMEAAVEDWDSAEDDPRTKECFQENDHNMHTAYVVSNSEETPSLGGENESCSQDCLDTNDSSATESSSSLFSKSNISSVEEWSRDIPDDEENSISYNIMLHDKVAALKNRIPGSLQLLQKRLAGGFRCRGKHRQDPSPFQAYLKTVLPEDGTSSEQENSAQYCSKEENLKSCCAEVSDERQTDVSSKDVTEQKTEGSCSLPVCIRRYPESTSKSEWPTARCPPGFLTRIPSLPLLKSGPVASSVALFGEKMVNGTKILEQCELPNENAYMTGMKHESEKKRKMSGFSTSIGEDEMDATSVDIKKGEREIDDFVWRGENWEDSILDIENVEFLGLENQLANVATVPGATVLVSKFHKEFGPEQFVPEGSEACASSMESPSIKHRSDSLCNSQNTLSGIPTISEYESSVKDEDLDSQHEDSMEDGFCRSSSQGAAEQSESDDNLLMINGSSKRNMEESRQNLDVGKDVSPRKRRTIHKDVLNSRNGMNCECPAECVQYWMWRNCLCQAPYLCSIQTETNGQLSRHWNSNTACMLSFLSR
jgi:hypothetical protein